jgi:ubiquinone biosynthesis accessory factor UbiJ
MSPDPAESRTPNPAATLADSVAAAAVNHLLRATAWARDELKRHGGKTLRVEILPAVFSLTVLDSGEVSPAAAGAAPAVTCRLTPGLMLRLAGRDESAWQEIDIAGDIDLAATVHQLARNLRWDVEEDLSRVFGDIAAHRMAETGRTLQRWGEQSLENLARSAAEYWTEEQPLIASSQAVGEFAADVDALRDDVARLEKRLEILSSRR